MSPEAAGPYARAAWSYRRAGWDGVLPLPPGRKKHPPEGFTGDKGVWPYSSEIQDWIESRPYGNICLRLPKNGVGIDIDAYEKKQGAKTLAGLEAKLGPLPPTIVSTSRDDGVSGIKLYRVPVRPGWRGKAGDNIEIIHFGFRYVIVWPSSNPENHGRLYRWIDERTGEILDHPPRFEDLPELPQAWVDFLSSDTPGPDKANVTAQEARDWFKSLSNGTRCQAVVEKLAEFHQALKSGSRHEAGLNCALALARFGAYGHHDVQSAVIEARDAFLKAVQADGPGKRVQREAEAEWARLVVGAYGVIKGDPTVEPGRECLCLPEFPGQLTGNGSASQSDTSPFDDIWNAREHLADIRQWARARMASPPAVLAVVLARVVAATPPFVVLPAIIGGEASLNLFIALVAPSGGGKGAAERTGRGSVNLDAGIPFTEIGVGSGEGLGHIFVQRVKGALVQHTTAALLSVPEVDTLAGLKSRQGSTLLPELRKAWSGEGLGFAYADPQKRLPLNPHAYRLCVVIGVQPERAGVLLDDTDSGTPQRLLWAPTLDPDAPEVTPNPPNPIVWNRPPDWRADRDGLAPMTVCTVATDTIRAARRARLLGQGDALDGHRLLSQLKTAAGLSLLAGRLDITKEDWQLAELILARSDHTRAGVVAALQHKAREAETARAASEGRRELIRGRVVADEEIKSACAAIVRKLGREGEWVSGNVVRHAVAGRLRGYYDQAVERLIDAGQVEVEHTDSNRPGIRLRLLGGPK